MSAFQEYFNQDHQMVRDSVRRFVEREILPHVADWEEAEEFPRELYRTAGVAGILGIGYPEQFGGSHEGDIFAKVAASEELMRCGSGGLVAGLGSLDIGLPPVLKWAKPAVRDRVVPEGLAGEKIMALAVTEPSGGSDVANLKTRAVREGEYYRINGSKTFITNGQLANLVIVVCKTNKDQGAQGMSLMVVETDEVTGFRRGRNLDKLGMDAQDTSELFFDDVVVPATNLLGGQEGMGFIYLMQELPQERLIVALAGIAAMELAMQETLAYTKERQAFGKPIFAFQNTRFKLAECQALLMASRALVDAAMVAHLKGELGVERAALIKYWISDNQCKLIDECLQLFGGYGYMKEYVIARLYADARVQRIYGGTNEIMKELASRFL